MKKIIICLIVIICSFILVIGMLLKNDVSMMNDNGKYIYFKLPALVKFCALMEREESYKAWIATMTDTRDSNEAKIEKIFNQIKDFPRPSELEELKEYFPSKYAFRNITQHEYQVLIKQQSEVGEQALNFCNIMAIAGYLASPIYNNYGLVVVRSRPKKFLYFNFEDRKMVKSGEILANYREIWEKKLTEIAKSSESFWGKEYLHAYAQIGSHKFWYTILPWRGKSKMEKYLIEGQPPTYLISSSF